eukprot:7710649-Pyramimonas_sp.AAC.4
MQKIREATMGDSGRRFQEWGKQHTRCEQAWDVLGTPEVRKTKNKKSLKHYYNPRGSLRTTHDSKIAFFLYGPSRASNGEGRAGLPRSPGLGDGGRGRCEADRRGQPPRAEVTPEVVAVGEYHKHAKALGYTARHFIQHLCYVLLFEAATTHSQAADKREHDQQVEGANFFKLVNKVMQFHKKLVPLWEELGVAEDHIDK